MILRYVRYAVRWRCWPSPLQREFMRGDPSGTVLATADRIIAELREDAARERTATEIVTAILQQPYDRQRSTANRQQPAIDGVPGQQSTANDEAQ